MHLLLKTAALCPSIGASASSLAQTPSVRGVPAQACT